MTRPVSGGAAVKRLSEVTQAVVAIAEREEGIALNLRAMANNGDVPPEFKHRAHARADSLNRLAGDLRKAVGAAGGRQW